MAKAQSPIRLQSELMNSASLAGELQNRSASEQIEYWASIGRTVSGKISANDLLELKAGLVSISLEKPITQAVDPTALLAEVDTSRESGALKNAIMTGAPRYQMSALKHGYLEQVHPDGTVITGQFEGGEFKACE